MRNITFFLIVILVTITGCVSIPEINRTMSEIDSGWATENAALMRNNGHRTIKTSRRTAFDALLESIIDMGMLITKQDYDDGIITARGLIPRPLSEEEWRNVKAIHDPKMQEYAATRHSSFTAKVFRLADSNFLTWMNAVITEVDGGVKISLSYQMEWIGPKSEFAYGKEPPPAAVKLGLNKAWRLLESNLSTVVARKVPQVKSSGNSVDTRKYVSTGTCFVVSPNGYLVTNDHVINNANEILVKLANGKKLPAKVVSSSASTDLAVLKVNSKNLDYLTFSSSRTVKLGEKIFTIGFPYVGVLGTAPKFTDGVISSKSGIAGEPIAYQITVPVQPGNSGGPLVNEKGQVIGVITSTASSIGFLKKTGNLPQNINWAVKSDYVLPLLEENPKEVKVYNRQNAIDITKKAICMVIAAE